MYEDNLSNENQYLIINNSSNYEKVSLYSTEFLGIDKACDEKFKLDKDDFFYLKKY